MTSLTEILVCPECGAALDQCAEQLECDGCTSTYPLVDGIPCFSEASAFYDEYAAVHCPYTLSPKGLKGLILKALPFWSYREWRFWRAALPGGGRLLDLGSGRGKEVFVEKADETVGLDGSLVFLRDCSRHYDIVVLAALPRLPFREETFDAVVSSHVLGHVAAEEKDALIKELARVLRPGGTTAHIIETDSTHPAIVAAKKHPDLYVQQLIEQDGHIGLEPANRVIERFEGHGFELVMCRVVDAIIPSVLYYDKYLDHPGYAELPGLTWTRALSRLNGATRLGNLAYEFGFGAFHRTLEQWFGDPARANFIHVVFRRRPSR